MKRKPLKKHQHLESNSHEKCSDNFFVSHASAILDFQVHATRASKITTCKLIYTTENQSKEMDFVV
jgi:hypothetical protein